MELIMKKFSAFQLRNKMIKILSCIIVLLLSIMACEKETELSFDFQVIEIVCFPNDIIYMTFKIIPEGGKEPYQIKWNEPSNFQGEGPFSVKINSDLSLNFMIQDSENISKRLSYEIKKDTIDSLKYDYRNRYIGTYSCDVVYSYIDSFRYYNDNLTVSKTDGFRNILITNNENDWGMNYLDSNQFYGYHRGVTFSNDSIYFSESGPLGFYYTNTYKGIRIITK